MAGVEMIQSGLRGEGEEHAVLAAGIDFENGSEAILVI
jgi:hypothetical protein